MFAWLAGKRKLAACAEHLHAAIVDQARSPHLYATLGVPDTVAGRFEMLALHMVLVVDRLGRIGPNGQTLARALNEAYVTAMDDTMRAIGVGDLSVPRKVKKATAGVYDRLQSYGPALLATASGAENAAGWDMSLRAAFAEIPEAKDMDLGGLTHYVSERAKTLAATPDVVLLAGDLSA